MFWFRKHHASLLPRFIIFNHFRHSLRMLPGNIMTLGAVGIQVIQLPWNIFSRPHNLPAVAANQSRFIKVLVWVFVVGLGVGDWAWSGLAENRLLCCWPGLSSWLHLLVV